MYKFLSVPKPVYVPACAAGAAPIAETRKKIYFSVEDLQKCDYDGDMLDEARPVKSIPRGAKRIFRVQGYFD
jgi:hypothetical protein